MTETASFDEVVKASRWTTTIGAVCEKFAGGIQTGPFGSQLHASDYSDDGTPVVMPQDMQAGQIVPDRIVRVSQRHVDRLHRHILREGDIVFSRRGDVSRFAVVTDREQGWLCGTGSIRIRLNSPDISVGYVRRYLQQGIVGKWLEHHAKGVTMPNLNTDVIRALPFVYPPLAEQLRIAAILDKADELRAKRRAALELLNGLTQAMFLEMFGDPAINPKNWPTTQLQRCVRLGDGINYGVVQPGEDYQNGVPLVRVGDLAAGRIQRAKLKRIDPRIEASYQRSRLRGDEVLVTCVGSIGVVALADDAARGFNIARAVARIPVSDELDRLFVAEHLRSESVRRYFTRELRIVSQPTLNIKQLGETEVFLPPIGLQREFGRLAGHIQHVLALADSQCVSQNSLFASLQHKAFAGAL